MLETLDNEYDIWSDLIQSAICGDCEEDCEDCPAQDILTDIEDLVFLRLENLFRLLKSLAEEE